MNPVAVCHLGRMPYREAWALQRRLQDRLAAAKRAGPPETLPHFLLLVEHPPVYTLGKSGDPAHLLLDNDALTARGATFVPVDRGGDITFHGPGQIVAYPILDLDRIRYPDGGRGSDVHRYLRELEEAVIRTCGDYGLAGWRVSGRTGVWVGSEGDERKICAFGVRCRRWVTLHGLALNANTDLGWFDHIVPCGIADRSVTSLAAELGRSVDEAEVTERLLARFAEAFGADLTRYRGGEALAYLDRYAPAEGNAPAETPAAQAQ